jgi:DNA invertase Pin-like site-specific DNA recombinase
LASFQGFEDAGISGAKRAGTIVRGSIAMIKAEMVATRSVDRLGRSLTDLLAILQGLHDKDADLDAAGKAMFQMLGVFAEFERGIIRERLNACLARAKAKGTKLGRRRIGPSVEARILELRAEGHGITRSNGVEGQSLNPTLVSWSGIAAKDSGLKWRKDSFACPKLD